MGEDVEDINNRVGEVGSCFVVHVTICVKLAYSSVIHGSELHLIYHRERMSKSEGLDMPCVRCSYA